MQRAHLYRLVMADPPLVTYGEARTLTLYEIADLHELLDLREENARRIAAARDTRKAAR